MCYECDDSDSDISLDVICNALTTGSKDLKTLVLRDTKINIKKDAQPLGRFLESCKSLRHIDLTRCKLTVPQLTDIFLSLTKNPHLAKLGTEVVLRGNPLGVGADKLEKALVGNSNIRMLDLSECDLADDGIAAVCRGVCRMSGLNKLLLDNNFTRSIRKSREKMIDSFIYLLAPERTLQVSSLSIANDPLLNKTYALKEDLETVINAFGNNESLIELDISGHLGGTTAAIALGLAVEGM